MLTTAGDATSAASAMKFLDKGFESLFAKWFALFLV
jgi:hypothetical protein